MSTAMLRSVPTRSIATTSADGRLPQISQTFEVSLESSSREVNDDASFQAQDSKIQQRTPAASSEPVRLSDLEIAAWCAINPADQQGPATDSPPDSLGANAMSGGQADEDGESREHTELGSLAEPSLLPPQVELSRGWARLRTVSRRYPVGALGAALLGAIVMIAFGVATVRTATWLVQPTKALHGSAR